MHAYNFFVRGPKFTNFFPHNSGWNVVDQVLFRFLLCQIGPEIFAIKVESYQKIVPNFLPSHILLGVALPKVVPTLGYAVDCFAHSGRSSWSSIYLHPLFQYSGTTVTNLTAFTNICSWSIRNKLTINIVKDCKTKEIAFHRPTLNIPPPWPNIKWVSHTTLLEIDITPSLSTTSVYVNRMLCK